MYDSRATSPSHRPSSPPPGRPSFDVFDFEEDDSQLSRTITAHNALDLLDETPPSPSLLSSTTNAALLSRKRLRLISRMFGQMCAAVQACHDVGIAHRDIKPENFIVMDGRGEGETGNARVVVKITDWGLGTREVECEDFDCGSKPYMAYGLSRPLLLLRSFKTVADVRMTNPQNAATTSGRRMILVRPTSGLSDSSSSTSSTTLTRGPILRSTIPTLPSMFVTLAASSKAASRASARRCRGSSPTVCSATSSRWRETRTGRGSPLASLVGGQDDL
jgi:serine/threonine protein kinase